MPLKTNIVPSTLPDTPPVRSYPRLIESRNFAGSIYLQISPRTIVPLVLCKSHLESRYSAAFKVGIPFSSLIDDDYYDSIPDFTGMLQLSNG